MACGVIVIQDVITADVYDILDNLCAEPWTQYLVSSSGSYITKDNKKIVLKDGYYNNKRK